MLSCISHTSCRGKASAELWRMWKGLKKALGKPGKAKKSSYDKYGLDVSNRSTASAAPSSVVFPLDLDAEAYAALQDQRSEHKHIHLHLSDVKPAGPLSAAQLQQHIQQQLALQKLAQPADDLSVSKRRATAMQKRIDNAMLNPSTCLYQIGSLLSLSTLFEHKVGPGPFCRCLGSFTMVVMWPSTVPFIRSHCDIVLLALGSLAI